MSNYKINIQPTTESAIVKFEADRFLTRHENFEFHNIDEAKNSPLAKQLFYLPFVKTIYIAQNFVAIEKYDIVEWADVQEEVASQIENYLNDGGEVITKERTGKTVPVTVYAESTPNPAVLKFVANKKLVLQAAEFKNIDDAKNAPLAQKLFHFPFVKEIFMDENYVSIQKYDIAEWDDITLELREFITKFIQEGNEVISDESAGQTPSKSAETPQQKLSADIENMDETSQQVVAILDEYIKPAVASDGGNILFDSYNPESKTVKVILQGACSGCPSSTMTLKSGIETMLRDMLRDKVQYVEAVNG